ncbi:response regulator [Roseomonas sp. M0104]|uniref:Response regulator n=1 Tax=Teichococcus coralli TaxID=2545983 RepID=A0A845BAN2_9PROT|nr:response regulator FixJ [Pseudoroseomonas coralli]MXP63156.1 response regulator [Pseudoroseomonas coralli]
MPEISPAAGEAAVHVIDDDEAVRHSLAFLFQCAGLAARTYDSAAAFLVVAPALQSGCVLADVRMPDIDGLALQRRLRELGFRLPLIFMTGHGDVPIAVQALKAGAFDFIEKPFDDEALLGTIRTALEADRRSREHEAERGRVAARLATLTPREHQVLERLVAGQSNKTIAADLGASPRTVEVHRARVMEKMGARNLSELVRMALSAGVAVAP